MIDMSALPMLKGKKALVTGIANDQSIAWGCAKAFRTFGADLAITYLNDKAKPYVEPLAKEVDASIFMPLNVQTEGEMEAVFDESHTVSCSIEAAAASEDGLGEVTHGRSTG